MHRSSDVFRIILLAINWLVLLILSLFLIVPFFLDADFEALILAAIIISIAFVFHKLINWIFFSSSLKKIIKDKGLTRSIYRQNKRLTEVRNSKILKNWVRL